jgi:hypothetical protein
MCKCAAGYDGEDEEERGEKSSCFGSLAESFAEDRSVEMVEVGDWVFALAQGGLCCHSRVGDGGSACSCTVSYIVAV